MTGGLTKPAAHLSRAWKQANERGLSFLDYIEELLDSSLGAVSHLGKKIYLEHSGQDWAERLNEATDANRSPNWPALLRGFLQHLKLLKPFVILKFSDVEFLSREYKLPVKKRKLAFCAAQLKALIDCPLEEGEIKVIPSGYRAAENGCHVRVLILKRNFWNSATRYSASKYHARIAAVAIEGVSQLFHVHRAHSILPSVDTNQRLRLMKALAVITLISALIVVGVRLFVDSELSALETHRERLMVRAKTARNGVERLRALHEMRSAVETQEQPDSMLRLLNELSRALPDNTYIRQISFGAELIVLGESGNSNQAVEQLRRSSLIQSLEVVTTAPAPNGRDRFKLRLEARHSYGVGQ